MKIKYSLFVPSYIPYFLESNRVIFVPLDKGTVILVDDKPGFRILNNHEKEMGKEIEKYYNQSSFTDEVGLTINYEVPNNWEFGTFIASIVGIEVVATYIKNKEVDISHVINKCSKYLSLLSISEIFVGPYLFKGSVRVDLKEGFTIKKTKNTRAIFIIGIKNLGNFKPSLEKLFESYKSINEKEAELENIMFCKSKNGNLVSDAEKYVKMFKPEKVIIARSFYGGIILYDHINLLSKRFFIRF